MTSVRRLPEQQLRAERLDDLTYQASLPPYARATAAYAIKNNLRPSEDMPSNDLNQSHAKVWKRLSHLSADTRSSLSFALWGTVSARDRLKVLSRANSNSSNWNGRQTLVCVHPRPTPVLLPCDSATVMSLFALHPLQIGTESPCPTWPVNALG